MKMPRKNLLTGVGIVIVVLLGGVLLRQSERTPTSPVTSFDQPERSGEPVSGSEEKAADSRGTASGAAVDWSRDWAAAWQRSADDSGEREALLSRLRTRRERMRDLMVEDPAAFMDGAVSLVEYAALPEEVKPFFEAPYSAVGSMDLLWETSLGPDGERRCFHRNRLQAEGETVEVVTVDGSVLPVMRRMVVNGVRLGDRVVMGQDPVWMLSSTEAAAARELFGGASSAAVDPVTGAENGNAPALVGGEVHRFADAEVARYVERTLRATVREAHEVGGEGEIPFEWLAGDDAGDLAGSEVDATPYQDDSIDVLFIRVDFSDFPGEPVAKGDLETTLNAVDGYLGGYSYGNAGIVTTVSDVVYRMPSTGESYAVAGDNDGIQTDARNLASADHTLANYDVIAVFFPYLGNVPDSKITYGGLASIGGGNQWVNGLNNTGVMLHEFGHNFGLYHANYYHPEEELAGTYQLPGILEYGDIFDEMGKGAAPEAHFNPLAQYQMRWLPDSKVAEATAGGTWRIYRFDDANALSNPTLALKVPVARTVNYWVGYRQLFTSSAYNLESAAYVVGENMGQVRETTLIDMTPESQPSDEVEDRKDAGLPVGTTYTDAEAGVRLTSVQRGGTAPGQWIDVRVEFDPRISMREVQVEVDEQRGEARVALQRKFNSSGVVSVDYATTAGTATAGEDYVEVSGTVTWEDGETADQTLVIPVRPDVIAEGAETFTLNLSNPAGGVIDPAAGAAEIRILDPGRRYLGFYPGFFNTAVNAIVPLENGQVVIGGLIGSGIGEADTIRHLARLNPDGSVDTGFQTGTGFNGQVKTIVRQPDGKLLVGGEFTSYNGTACNRLVRLNADGTVDGSFATAMGTAANASVECIALENDGGILVGGSFDRFDGVNTLGLIRLLPGGGVDTGNELELPFQLFSGGGTPVVYCLLVEPDGKIMVGGSLYTGWTGTGYRGGVARLNTNGTRDVSFDPDAGAHADGNRGSVRPVYALSRASDGTYVIGGFFTAYDENPAPYVARITSNGTFDGTFTPPSFNGSVRDLLLQPVSGNAVAGGDFDSPVGFLERLEASGVADTTFNPGSGPGGPVYTVTDDHEGQLWIGGNFFSFNGVTSRPVARLAGGVSAYDVWAATEFTSAEIASGASDPGADPDGDGMVNLAELAMGTNPTLFTDTSLLRVDAGSGIELVESAGESYLQITLPKPTEASGVWYAAQFSGDLITWSPSNPSPGSSEIVVVKETTEWIVVRDTVPISPGSPRFGRIVVVQPE